MCRVPVFIGALLLTASTFAQQPDTSQIPNPDTYNQNAYNRPAEVRTGYGNWGLLGLLGLAGLLGLRRGETVARGRDEYLDEQRRRVA
jgi:MYXO-CTERM domain-containing protein